MSRIAISAGASPADADHVRRNSDGMQPWIDPGSNASLLDAADDDSAAA